MKILLVNPPNSGRSIPEEEYGIENMRMIFRGEPLALEVIAGNLTDHETVITDLKVSPDALEADLEDFRPDIVGITGVTCEANAMLDIARTVRKHGDAAVVVGGHHASCDPDYFNRPEVDYIVAGLGKRSFRELVTSLQSGTESAVPGVGRTRPGNALKIEKRRFSQADLVEDMPPRYDLIAHNRDHYVMSGVGGKAGFVVSAYGCTHRCAFCAIPNMTDGRYLVHQAETVMRDIRLVGELPLIRLVDANTFGVVPMSEELARLIIASGLKRQMVADVRSDTVVRHPELFSLWKSAGLAGVVIGFEEIRNDRLKDYNKRNDIETNITAMEILNDLGIRIIADYIVSTDYTPSDFEALERFIADHPASLSLTAILTPIPGTPLYERIKDRIHITNLDYYTFTNAVTPTRMPEKDFYQAYAALMNRCIQHVRH